MSNDNVNKNYVVMNPNKMINILTKLYSSNFEHQPTKMLWGAPGVGKTQLVHQTAEKLAKVTGKKVNVIVASLLLMSPIDLRGIPAKDVNKETGDLVARWLPPEIFKMNPSDDVINFLFLDEISAAPPSVQAAAYQIALDKRIGEHVLPKNTIVICGGNRVTDKSVAYKMPKALCNRMTHIEIRPSVDDWKIWAYDHGIDSRIIGFVNYNHDMLNRFDPNTDDVAFPTPRSWEMVNQYLQCGSFDDMYAMIAGTIGMGTTLEFKTYIEVYDKLPLFEDIASGKLSECPENIVSNRPDILCALSALIASRIREKFNSYKNYRDKNVRAEIDTMLTNVGKFIKTMPADKKFSSRNINEYVTLCVKDTMSGCSPEMASIIVSNKEFSDFISSLADLLSDVK